jgi:predicted Zn-ribbon and HTH transcriptional regulator
MSAEQAPKKIGRPSKLEKLAEKHPKTIKGVKTIIKPAPKEIREKVLEICRDYKKNGGRIPEACKRCGMSDRTFFYQIRRFPECREIAQKYGIGLKGDQTVQVVNAKPAALKNDESAFSIFDLPTRKEWNAEQKQDAIRKAMEALEVGVPFAYAVRYSGMTQKLLTDWITEEPGLLDVLLRAESKWTVTFFKCLTKAAIVASEKGRFLEIVQGAERRFASQWGKVQAIDLTLKQADGSESVVKMDRNTIDSQFEKEMKESEIEDQKAERRR